MSQYPSDGDFLASGTVLRGYEIGSVVGRGGFGVVYKGHHGMLDTRVAIKEYLPSELARRRSGVVQPTESRFEESFEDGLQRFIAEGRRLQAIQDHPNIVSCRDLFQANGTAYMVMDYVDGLPLSALLEQREKNGEPFTERDLLHVILPLLDGLGQAHESGLYHRDIKPSNILIRRKDNQPVLIDFGAAKQETGGATKSMAPYTDGYAAMEQIGEGEIGPWTDIYGVGALMWRMVAGGNPPWEPPSPTKVQHRAFAALQGMADPLPSASVVGSIRFSSRLLESIDQCLEISVPARIRSSHNLIAKISARDIVSEPLSVKSRVSTKETVKKPRKKKRKWLIRIGLFIAIFSVLYIGLVVAFHVTNLFKGDEPRLSLLSYYLVPLQRSERSYFMLGSTATEVLRVQGRPYRVVTNRSEGVETWRYWLSKDISFDLPTMRVREVTIPHFENDEPFDFRAPSEGSALAGRMREGTYFTHGSHADEVLQLQGKSTKEHSYPKADIWYYDLSTVTLDVQTRRVIAWSNLSRNLKARVLEPPREFHFTRGSHMDSVLAVQGKPTYVERNPFSNYETWYYGLSTVTFDARIKLVLQWRNEGNLNVKDRESILNRSRSWSYWAR